VLPPPHLVCVGLFAAVINHLPRHNTLEVNIQGVTCGHHVVVVHNLWGRTWQVQEDFVGAKAVQLHHPSSTLYCLDCATVRAAVTLQLLQPPPAAVCEQSRPIAVYTVVRARPTRQGAIEAEVAHTQAVHAAMTARPSCCQLVDHSCRTNDPDTLYSKC
jgi:hypothetical protein